MRTAFLILALSYFSINAISQVCGSINIATQTQIDNLTACTTIDGNLWISESLTDPITDLSFLKDIELITGSTSIASVQLPVIDFENLSESGSISIIDVDTDSVLFSQLQTVNGNFSIVKNLSSVDSNYVRHLDIPFVETFERILLSNNSHVDHLDLQFLDTLREGQEIYLLDNGFHNLNFDNLAIIRGSLFITGDSLRSIDFPLLMSIDDKFISPVRSSLSIGKCEKLHELNFPILTQILGSFHLYETHLIENLNFLFDKVGTSVSQILISNNDQLSDLSSLRSIIEADNLIFRNNINQNLDFLSNLKNANRISIEDNVNLTDISGLNSLWLSNNVSIRRNILLSECCFAIDWVNNNFIDNVLISDNNHGCDNMFQIIQNCQDADADGIEDSSDNCPLFNNPDQTDSNNNGIGDLCEDVAGNDETVFSNESGDIFVENFHRGIIMKSSNGKCYRIIMRGDGVLSSTHVTCPE